MSQFLKKCISRIINGGNGGEKEQGGKKKVDTKGRRYSSKTYYIKCIPQTNLS